MHVLFIHQNCPAQFHYIAPGLVGRGWDCTFVTAHARNSAGEGVRKIVYRPCGGAPENTYAGTAPFQNETAHARGVYEALKQAKDVRPDVVVAHSGFGSSLFVPHLYDAPIINFFEFFFRTSVGTGQYLGYRPELPVTESLIMRLRLRNACFLLDLDNCDRGWCPNRAQFDTLPMEYRHKVDVIPEGIDTDFWKPGARGDGERVLPGGRIVPAGTRIVTYTARGLERIRGFDVFMKMAKRVYERFPNVLFVVVGENKSYYCDDSPITGSNGVTFRDHVLMQDDYDLSKFWFPGSIKARYLAEILGMSDLHVYLTEPFVTSWSLLDAMSSGCVMLTCDPPCVREYIQDGENGLLGSFLDAEGLAERALAVLADLPGHRHLGEAARRTIVEGGYALADTLPRIDAFFREVAAKPRSPSARADLLIRPHAIDLDPSPLPVVSAAEPYAGERMGEGLARLTRRVEEFQPSECRSESSPSTSARHDPPPPDAGRTSPSPLPLSPAYREEGKQMTILFTWELGAGLGHIMEIAPLVAAMCERGHRVYAAMRDLTDSAKALDPRAVLLPASYLANARVNLPRCATRNFADILATQTFGDDDCLLAHAKGGGRFTTWSART